MNITLQTAAAEALVAALPVQATLTVRPANPTDEITSTEGAITGSYIGALSADLGIVLQEGLISQTGPTAAFSPQDVLRPSLEAAASSLGVGVLGDVRQDNAGAIFTSSGSALFVLLAVDGSTAGYFAIRVRENTGAAGVSNGAGNLSRINNVEMALTVEIGRTRMSVRETLDMEPGAVIELDRSAGDPADVLLNGRLIARGEVVVVDQDYAVRITQILDTAEGQN